MNAKNGMRAVHPGEVLRDELDELGLSANALSKALGVPVNRVCVFRSKPITHSTPPPCVSAWGTASTPRASSTNAPARARAKPDRSPATARKEEREAEPPRGGRREPQGVGSEERTRRWERKRRENRGSAAAARRNFT